MSVQAPPYWNGELSTFVSMVNSAWALAGYPAVRVTSWYRDPYDNAVAGGMPTSQHLQGLAIDVLPDAGGTAFANAARAVGLVPVDEGSHWHVQRYSRTVHTGA